MKKTIAILILLASCSTTVDPDQKEFDIGMSNFKAKNYERAITFFDKAIEINPKRFEFWGMKGIAYLHLADGPNGCSSLEKAMRLKERDEDKREGATEMYEMISSYYAEAKCHIILKNR